MRLGLASLLVALLLLCPSQAVFPVITSTTSTSYVEDETGILPLHSPSRSSNFSSTTSTTFYPSSKKFDSSSEEEESSPTGDYENFPTIVTSYSQQKHELQSGNLEVPRMKKKKEITVGYLTAVKELFGRQGLTISGALTMALNEVVYLLQLLNVFLFALLN